MKKIIKDKFMEILEKVPLAKNLSRKKFIGDFLLGMIDSKKVQFHEIALHMGSEAKDESVERRIQAFFKDYEFDYKQVCLMLSLFLPKGKVVLSIDRTEWDFGKYQCNILMVAARVGAIGIPLYWELLDNKSGNSSASDRVALLKNLVSVIGKGRVGAIVGDREFVGIEWVKYLKNNDIPFCMRLPKHHSVSLKNGSTFLIEELLEEKEERFFQGCLVDGIVCSASMKKLPEGDFLFLMGSFRAKELGPIYRKRWCIEVLFQNFKKRGFDLEDTHLKCSKKLAKLLVFVSLSVAACVMVGEYYHKKVQKIKTKKHGYKANSFFRKGLDFLRGGIKNPKNGFAETWSGCIKTFLRWIELQITYNQSVAKIIG